MYYDSYVYPNGDVKGFTQSQITGLPLRNANRHPSNITDALLLLCYTDWFGEKYAGEKNNLLSYITTKNFYKRTTGSYEFQ